MCAEGILHPWCLSWSLCLDLLWPRRVAEQVWSCRIRKVRKSWKGAKTSRSLLPVWQNCKIKSLVCVESNQFLKMCYPYWEMVFYFLPLRCKTLLIFISVWAFWDGLKRVPLIRKWNIHDVVLMLSVWGDYHLENVLLCPYIKYTKSHLITCCSVAEKRGTDWTGSVSSHSGWTSELQAKMSLFLTKVECLLFRPIITKDLFQDYRGSFPKT